MAYHQVPMEESRKKYTAFCEPVVIGYLDDIIIINDNFEDNLKWISFVLGKSASAGLMVNPEKCEFGCSRVTYLGYVLDSQGLRTSTKRLLQL